MQKWIRRIVIAVMVVWLLRKSKQWHQSRIDDNRPRNMDADRTHILTMPDGRRIAFDSYGDPDGKPAIYIHGTPGSRLEGAMLHDAALERGYHLIVPDRAGMGLSDYDPNRTIKSTVQDIAFVADELDFEEFALFGASGGFPYLAASCLIMPERITTAAVCAGWVSITEMDDTPVGQAAPDLIFSDLAQYVPVLLLPAFSLMRYCVRVFGVEGFKLIFAEWSSVSDANALEDELLAQHIYNDAYEGFSQGANTVLHDVILCFKPWGFTLSDITKTIHIFQGLDDKMVAPTFSEHAHDRLPNSTLELVPDAGHYYWMQNFDRVLDFVEHYDPDALQALTADVVLEEAS